MPGSPTPRPGGRRAGVDREPRWYPSGDRIAFVSDQSGDPEIWAMNADGTRAAQLTEDLAAAFDPEWVARRHTHRVPEQSGGRCRHLIHGGRWPG